MKKVPEIDFSEINRIEKQENDARWRIKLFGTVFIISSIIFINGLFDDSKDFLDIVSVVQTLSYLMFIDGMMRMYDKQKGIKAVLLVIALLSFVYMITTSKAVIENTKNYSYILASGLTFASYIILLYVSVKVYERTELVLFGFLAAMSLMANMILLNKGALEYVPLHYYISVVNVGIVLLDVRKDRIRM